MRKRFSLHRYKAENTFTDAKRSRIPAVIAAFLLAAGMVMSLALPVLAQGPGNRSFGIYDHAGLLNPQQTQNVIQQCRQLSETRDINVIIVTTEDKGPQYANSDSGSEQYAADIYNEKTGAAEAEDGSGFLFLMDMQNRYLYIYTYDSIHTMLSDKKCIEITDSIVTMAQLGNYEGCIVSVLDGVGSGIDDFHRTRLTISLFIRIGGPLVVTSIVLLALVLHKRSKKTTSYETYIDAKNCKTISDIDQFTHNTVVVTTHTSSSSGGGGGGGGGGRSGGGGSHF